MNKIQAMELASGLTRLITGMEDELLQNIAAYLLAGKADSSTSKWKIRKLAELGKLHQKNIETITSYAKEQRELAELTVKLAAVDAMQDTERGFRKAVIAGLVTDAADGTMDSTMNTIIGTLMKQAKNDLNIVNTTMLYKARDAAGKAVRDAAQLANKQEFVDMLNKAAGQVVTNTETMTAAVSKCLKDMANNGIPAFVDRGGREWSPEAYVGLCVRQTAMNTGTTALFERMKDYHTHFIEISSHLGARPKCSRDQGRIFDLDNTSGYIEDGRGNTIEYSPWSSSSYGQPDGILGINCKHSAFPFTPGSSLQTYFPYDQEENDKRYKEIQKQRELERNVRAAKRECAMLKNGDPEEFKKASVRLKERTAQLKQYCSEHDLTYMNERTSVLGYGHSEASKVTAAYRKALKEEEIKLYDISVDKSGNSGIIKSKFKPIADEDIKNVPYMDIFNDNSLDLAHQQASCDLLEKVKELQELDENDKGYITLGTEISIIFDEHMNDIPGHGYVKGFSQSTPIDDYDKPYHAFHNHPSNGTFSLDDIYGIIERDNMRSLTAQGERGSKYVIIKTESCDSGGFETFIRSKEKDVIYTNGDIKFSLSFMTDSKKQREYEEALDKLSDSQFEELRKATYAKMEECLMGGDKYGFKYQCKNT